ncbi:MAG: response regulator [Actinomycetota bacterium]|nr:response regulator [Actinomycetota bacterium]
MNGVQILLVEDNPSDLALALHAFKRNNLTNGVHVARDGEEAMSFLFKTGPHSSRTPDTDPQVILLDLKLPKVDGLEVLGAIKRDPRTSGIPVVILTSSAAERDVVESYALGVNSYIVKPVDFDQFSEAVRSIGFYWLLLNRAPERPQVVGAP